MSLAGEQAGTRLPERLLLVAMVLLALSIFAMSVAAFAPVEFAPPEEDLSRSRVEPVPTDAREVPRLLAEIAGRRLIKPAQVQAAVKDTGAAERLVKQLNLQGVIEMGGQLTAYIAIKGQGVTTVKQGDKVLAFVVQEISPGRVVLSLEGVEVTLGH